MTKFSIVRKHEIHAGHRVYNHGGKCGNLHGHSYVFHFHCSADALDDLGMVIDFAVIKTTLCKWLDDNYDHRMILWEHDPLASQLSQLDSSIMVVPYNPTAENIAAYLLNVVAPQLLGSTSITVNKIELEETSKCRAICEL